VFDALLRRLRGPLVSQLAVIRHDGSAYRLIHETDMLIEAPNWSPDGAWLVFNGEGRLWRVRVDAPSKPECVHTGGVSDIGNDHVFSPDGRHLFFTAGGVVYRTPANGGEPHAVSLAGEAGPDLFVHGVSPDGQLLSCVGFHRRSGRTDIRVLSVAEGTTHCVLDAGVPVDGPEFSPDGRWIFFNGELGARRRGDSQVFRMRPDGSGIERLTADESVNWFPHVSPDGRRIACLGYPAFTEGHPRNRRVALRCLTPGGGQPHDIVRLFGGQGSLNCNSWAPDSTWLAYIGWSRDGLSSR
jgi:Tol biopolymer transport system component